MIGAARVVLAVVPFAAWAALAATAAGWPTVGGLALGWWLSWLAAHASREGIARFAGITAVGCAIGVMWVAVRSLMDPPWWGLPLLLAVPAVLWWHAIWTHLPAPERDRNEDELDDGPPRRAVIVRDANEAGVDIGGIDSSFDYPDDEHHPRTPPPGWEPRSMVTGGSPIVGVFADDGPDELDDSAPEVDGPLPGRLLAAWPVKTNGDPYASVHAADLAALVGVDEDDVIAAVTAEFGSCEKVTARPLTPNPATGKRGQATGRKGLRYAALREWVGATARATS